MSARALAVAVAVGLLGGCFGAPLGDAPAVFTCSTGRCPSGYHCARSLCVRDGEIDPPILATTVSIEAEAARLLWDGTSFGLMTRRQLAGDVASYSMTAVGASGAAQRWDIRDIDTTALSTAAAIAYWPDAAGGAYVLAVTENTTSGSTATVYTFDRGAPAQLLGLPLHFPAEPLGLSPPYLTVNGPRVLMAYTLNDVNSVRCHQIEPRAGTLAPTCTPYPFQTTGRLATDVVLADNTPDGTAAIVWRHVTPQLSLRSYLLRPSLDPVVDDIDAVDGISQMLPGLQRVARGAWLGNSRGFVQERQSSSWDVFMFQNNPQMPNMTRLVPPAGFVPDILVVEQLFHVCLVDEQGALTVRRYSEGPVLKDTIAVPRLSQATIRSCSIAYAPERRVLGVAWKESVPASTARIYLQQIPLP